MEAEVAVSGEMHDKDDHRRTTVEKRRHKRRRLSGPASFTWNLLSWISKSWSIVRLAALVANMRERRSKAEEE